MRKREIHSVAHWAMMFLLLMFPLLMVGASCFQKNEGELSTVTESVNIDDLQYNENYTLVFTRDLQFEGTKYLYANYIELSNYEGAVTSLTGYDVAYFYGNNQIAFDGDGLSTLYKSTSNVLSISFTYISQNSSVITGLDGCFKHTYTYDAYNYKNDVNYWIGEFIDLPINSWYKSLMNVIGVGFTNSSVMNVIYVMPVYILWVFIFDVIVDCFLVIIKLPHKLLNRLSGGENE